MWGGATDPGPFGKPWLVMKLVAAIMDTPNERYVASSELASLIALPASLGWPASCSTTRITPGR